MSLLSSEPVVVLGIMLKDGMQITADSMFAFAKISLLHTETALAGMGVRLEIVSISRTHPSGLATPPTAAAHLLAHAGQAMLGEIQSDDEVGALTSGRLST